jgi:putative ABC transport system permease protein
MSEMALTVVLMIGAGLLLRTFWGLLREDPGFKTSRVVTAGIWLPNPNDPKTNRYPTIEVQSGFVREALRRISGIPGVELAAATSSLPSGSSQVNYAPLAIENQPIESSNDAKAEWIRVSPDYFKVLEIPLQQGRLFNEDDKSGKPEVAIIDRATAGRYWPGANPLGKRIKLGPGNGQPWVTVVGVINDVKHDGLDKDGIPHIYRPDYQTRSRIINFVIRTSLPASVLERQIREEIQTIDPGLPVYNVRSMDDVVGASLAIRRFSASLVSAFAVVGLLLVSIGIYGILAHLVSQRSREIAIRMALGARAVDIFKMILGKGALIAAIGILCGLSISLLVAPAMKALLYSVPPIDPPVFIAVPALLLGVALLASFMPARKAAGRNPNAVLHEE